MVSPFLLAQVHQVVKALPAGEREALMLACVNGLSYQDAAQRLGIAPKVIVDHLLRDCFGSSANSIKSGNERDMDQIVWSPSL
jgi:predicted DNA-binding protein (UPF0251 family)